MRNLTLLLLLATAGACGSSSTPIKASMSDAAADGAGVHDAAAGELGDGLDLATGGDLRPADAGSDTTAADRSMDTGAPDVGSAGDALVTTTVTCPGNTAMTTFNSACSVELDCMIAFHLADSCGSLAAIGLHRSEEARWSNVENACRAATPLAPCPSKPTTTEDGKTGVVSQIAVTCEAGKCRTCTGCRPPPPPGARASLAVSEN